MSCEDCSEVQNKRDVCMPIRIGTGNLLVFGCQKHCKQLLDWLAVLHNLTNYLRESKGITPAEKEEIMKRFGIF